ncbi:hypothetical protein KKA53_02990 [Candidatus Dependentiae bacterium]|nr:hypothetical protein [Candidatus Dependentiae bacterium]
MIKNLTLYLINFVKVQTIVTIASLPILITWGIPISLMSFVGNFIFTPFLAIFLILSSIVFFTELLSIPNGLFIDALSATTSYWEVILSLGKKTWLIGFAKPKTTLTILLAIFVMLLVLRFTFRILSKLVFFGIFALALFMATHFIRTSFWPVGPKTKFIPNCSQQLAVTRLKNKTIQLTDYGFFTQKRSPQKFVSFELKPYLIKTYGSTTIDKITLHNPSEKAFTSIEELCKTFTIREVSVPYFNYRLSRYGWKCFFSLKKMILSDGGKFTRFRQTGEPTSHHK